MADKTAEAVYLVTLATKHDLHIALSAAFVSPEPSPCMDDFINVSTLLGAPETQLAYELLTSYHLTKDPFRPNVPQQFRVYHTYPDGTKAMVGTPPTFTWIQSEPRPSMKHTKKVMDAIMRAASKCGVPKDTAEKMAGTASGSAVMKRAVTRYMVVNGAMKRGITNAGLTAVIDFRLLFDGELKKYFTKIGVSGLHGCAVGGLGRLISHPFFGNNAVLGVLVGAGLGVVTLASTGDIARFGKDVGVNICGASAAHVGAQAGFRIGSSIPMPLLQPFLAGGFSVIGGLAAGWTAGWAGSKILSVAEMTDCEVMRMYKRIKDNLATIGMEPDPSLSPREIVMATLKGGQEGKPPFEFHITPSMDSSVRDLYNELDTLLSSSPEEFDNFLELLRVAIDDKVPKEL
jgi:hypothetical protein